MINDAIGSTALHDGREMRRTRLGEEGHVVYGPYTTTTHGVYRVDFSLALANEQVEDDQICAIVEVTADWGYITIAQLPVRTSALSTKVETFSLLFVLRDIQTLEYRVFVNGHKEMLVGLAPVMTRISGVLDELPRADLGPLAEDPASLGRDTRRILRELRPYAIKGHAKVRLGNPGDGGYVCIDDFTDIDTAFSLGINDDISWDIDAADRGLLIYQFDHTVSDPAPGDRRMIFEPKMIDRITGPGRQALSDLIRAHDKRRPRPNIVLKMDIEGGEWPVIDSTPSEDLSRIAWIVCELHYFQGLAERGHRDLIDRCLGKLGENFAVVHVHANVWGGFTSLANVIYPNVIEVTFVNRAHYVIAETDEVFPTTLDQSCDPAQPDFHLGMFRF